jgi:hypothetical protein
MIIFSAKIFIIGINPYVLLPAAALKELFKQAGKDRGAIPVKGTIDGHAFLQNLVKYSGKWRLYLNTPMRKAAGKDVGDTAVFGLCFDPKPRVTDMPPALQTALDKNKKAKTAFEQLSPSYRKEIMRYINNLKTEESINRNVTKAINHLLGNGPFIGREK